MSTQTVAKDRRLKRRLETHRQRQEVRRELLSWGQEDELEEPSA
jgi:hypothetical protein